MPAPVVLAAVAVREVVVAEAPVTIRVVPAAREHAPPGPTLLEIGRLLI